MVVSCVELIMIPNPNKIRHKIRVKSDSTTTSYNEWETRVSRQAAFVHVR